MSYRTITLAWVIALMLIGCDRGKSASTPPPPANSTSAADPAAGTVQWVDPKSLKEGPIQRETLSTEQMDRISKLYDIVAEVDGSSMDKWVDGFKRDVHPDDEIAVWERMAKAYEPFVASHRLSLPAKKEAFKIILMRSMAGEDDVLARLQLKVLTRAEAIELMHTY
jgi:hypothetical protein